METTSTLNRTKAPSPGTNGDSRGQERTESPPRRARTRNIIVIAGVVVTALAIFLVLGVVYRLKRDHGLAVAANAVATTPPRVQVVHAIPSATSELSLP